MWIAPFLFLTQAIPAVPYHWRNVEIVGGGFVTGIICHPKAKDVVYARTDIGGAYRWNPKSGRWIPLQDFLTRPDWNLYGAESVGLDPSDPMRAYIAAGTYTNSWGGNGAILRTKDGGKTWDRIDLPFKNGGNEDGRSIGERLMVDPNDGRVIYFGTRHVGLMRSTDYGSTWHQVDGFPVKGPEGSAVSGSVRGQGVGWVIAEPTSGKRGSPSQTLYAGTCGSGGNLWVSRDGGKVWGPVENQPAGWIPHQIKRLSNGQFVIVFSDKPGPNGISAGNVFRYDPKTSLFTEITPEKPGPGNTFGYAGVAVSPQDPKVIMVSTLDRWAKHDTVFRTIDGGKTWRSLGSTAKRDPSKAPYLLWNRKEAEFGHWIGDVEIDPFNPDRAWYVTGATIWGTTDLRKADSGGTTHWVPMAEGLEETAVLDLKSPPLGAHVISALGDIAGFAHFDLTKSPSGGMWSNPLWNSTNGLDYAGLQPLTVIRFGREQGAISKDGGNTWKPFGGKPTGLRTTGTIAISADARTLVWQPGGQGAFWSTDEGTTWTASTGEPTSGFVISDRINPDRFYILNGRSGIFYRSDDAGRSFRPVAGLLKADRAIPFAVVGKTGHIWIPLGAGGLAVSKDGGSTFRRINTTEDAFRISFGKAQSPGGYPTAYLIGTVRGVVGVFRSTDECRTWVRINDAATGYGTMDQIEGDPKVFGRVYVGTNGRGVLVADPR